MNEEETAQLIRAIRRDLSGAIMLFASSYEDDTLERAAWKRLIRNWDRLCAEDLAVAAGIYHGIDEVRLWLAQYGKPNSPAAYLQGEMNEAVGVMKAGSAANPDARVGTIGELYELGRQAIQDEIERDLTEEE
jgi:hypothetical protein